MPVKKAALLKIADMHTQRHPNSQENVLCISSATQSAQNIHLGKLYIYELPINRWKEETGYLCNGFSWLQ